METLVVISETGNVLMMTRMWDVLQETPLFQQDFGEGCITLYTLAVLCLKRDHVFFFFKL